jgi:V/A-type H+-transporting ATPase subunit K
MEGEDAMNLRYPLAALALLGLMSVGSVALAAEAQPEGAAAPADMGSVYRTIGLGLAAALTAGICIAGASHAVARVGSAAMGAVAEKPELVGRTILFVALAEGLGVLGFVIAIMLIFKI